MSQRSRGVPRRPGDGAVVIAFPGRGSPAPGRAVVVSAPTIRQLGRSTAFQGLGPGDTFRLASGVPAAGQIPLDEAIALVLADWRRQNVLGGIADLTLDRSERFLGQFAKYASAMGATEFGHITPAMCSAFVSAPIAGTSPSTKGKTGRAPSGATQNGRLNVVRVLFMTARLLGLDDRDPTSGIKHVPNTRSNLRPLTPAEVRTLTDVASTGKGTKAAVSLALALAGSGITEMAYVTIGDIDLAARTVLLYGRGQRLQGRRNHLDDWATAQIRRRLTALAKNGHTGRDWPLVLPQPVDTYDPNHVSPQASRPFYTLFDRASLAGSGIRPSSISEYAANRAYALTGDVEQVASLVGLASLVSARSLISPTWQQDWAETVRLEAAGR